MNVGVGGNEGIRGVIVAGRSASRFGVVSGTSAGLAMVGFLWSGAFDPSLEVECFRLFWCSWSGVSESSLEVELLRLFWCPYIPPGR